MTEYFTGHRDAVRINEFLVTWMWSVVKGENYTGTTS